MKLDSKQASRLHAEIDSAMKSRGVVLYDNVMHPGRTKMSWRHDGQHKKIIDVLTAKRGDLKWRTTQNLADGVVELGVGKDGIRFWVSADGFQLDVSKMS